MHIPLAKPYFDEHEINELALALRSGWVSQGPKVVEFEKRLADYLGVKHAVATSSATTALHLVLLIAGVKPGDEVICPSYSFIATANSICHAGATPVFADIEAHTFNLDPDGIEPLISPKTRAILLVHQIGLPADLDRFYQLAARYKLAVIEDAAPTLGATYKGRLIGHNGRFVCFSFHPRKVITTGEGGLITTDDDSVAEQARILRSQGASISDLDRHKAKGVVFENYPVLGYNYRMSDIHAAIGIRQMDKLQLFLDKRRELALRYHEKLRILPSLQLPSEPDYATHSWQSYSVVLSPAAHISRDILLQKLAEKGISARRGIASAHKEPVYADSNKHVSLPVTERMTAQAVMLPIYYEMTREEQDYVVQTLQSLLG